MEITPFLIYLISIADGVRGLAGFGCLAFFLAGFIYISIFLAKEGQNANYFWNAFKKCLWCFCISVALIIFVPSKTTIAGMIVVPAVANNAEVKNISSNLLKWAEVYLNDLLEEQTRKPKENKKNE